MDTLPQGRAFGDPAGHSRTADVAACDHPVPNDGSLFTGCARRRAGNRGRERGHAPTEVQSTEPVAPLNHPAPGRSSRSPAPVSALLDLQGTGRASTPDKVPRASLPDSIMFPIPQSGTRRKPEGAASGMPARRFAPRPGPRT